MTSTAARLFPTLSRVAQRLRRQVLLRRRWLAAASAGLAVFVTVQSLRAPSPPVTLTVIAGRDLPAGTVLTTTDLAQAGLPHEAVPAGALPRSAAVGAVLASPVRRGEPLTDARILGPGLTLGARDRAALAVRIGDVSSLDLVRTGDAVDVIAVPSSSPGASDRGSRVLVRDARVLSLPPPTDGSRSAGAVGPLGEQGRVAVLEVARSQTVEISESAARDWLTVALTQ